MKTKIGIGLLLIVISALASGELPFRGWDRLEKDSSCIIVADPSGRTQNPDLIIMNGGRYDFNITILSKLKGTNDLVHARLLTNHELHPGESYLIFAKHFVAANHDNGILDAFEDYKVIPLGITYKQEMIEGKPLDEQLQILFKLAVDHLNEEIGKEQAERDRIASGIIK